MTEDNKTKFSEYPKVMDEYFSKNPVIVRIIPDEFMQDLEKRFKPKKLTSANDFIKFINDEIDFWSEHDKSNKLNGFTKIHTLKSAKDSFEKAKQFFLEPNNNVQNGVNYLNSCRSDLSHGILYSRTALAKYLLQNINLSSESLRGFKCGISVHKTTSINNSIADYEGLCIAMQFRKLLSTFETYNKNELTRFNEIMELAEDKYIKLNEEYTKSFHNQEENIETFTTQCNEKIQQLTEKSNEYFDQKNKRLSELESLYQEKLSLEAPAQYWEKMHKDYLKDAYKWIIIGGVMSIILVISLFLILNSLPNLYSDDSHWFDIFKNSAILTIITSIMVYILRTFIKLSISSFHLARDAKERNKLTYFYLSLIEKKAVTEKERAIILNSLFSRSDTGLLKGDSAPSMSANITDLMNSLNK